MWLHVKFICDYMWNLCDYMLNLCDYMWNLLDWGRLYKKVIKVNYD